MSSDRDDKPTSPRARARDLLPGLAFASVFIIIVALAGPGLSRFELIGPTEPFQYPWRLTEPSHAAQVTAWLGYSLHNLGAWLIIAWARRSKAKFRETWQSYNWAMLGLHVVFGALHIVRTHVWYDGLARDVPELSALASVALMLMVVLLLENPRRGLVLGKRLPGSRRLRDTVSRYHGYLFTWALIYTFWYHPAESTLGHLVGFFYLLLLLWQSVLIYARAHLDRRWTLALEILVIPHAVAVAVVQDHGMWAMFAFGFGSIFVLTQMYGLGWPRWARATCWWLFVASALVCYHWTRGLSSLHEIARIPVLDYAVVVFLAALHWVVERLVLARNSDARPDLARSDSVGD